MFDPKRAIRASRPVSMRDLSRSAGALIDEIELNGSVFVLSRHGRMVAVLAPLPERTVVEFKGSEWPAEVEADIAPEATWSELDDIERAVLRSAAEAHPMPFGLNGMPFAASELGRALGRLELDGFIERSLSGRRLTREGLAAARWLDSLDVGTQ